MLVRRTICGRCYTFCPVTFAFAVFLGSMSAVSADDRDTCRVGDPKNAIAACTREINSKRYTGGSLADRFFNRGFAYNSTGDYDRAIQDYSEAIRINPTFEVAYNNRGIIYSTVGSNDRAILDYSQAIRLNPVYATAYYNRGVEYRKKGENDRAISDYSEAIKIDPAYVSAYNDRGAVLNNKKEYDKAIEDLNEAIRLNPNHAYAFTNRGNAYLEKGNSEQAIKDHTESIRLDPSNADRWNWRCWTRAVFDQLQAALADCNESLRLKTTASALDSRGFTYLKMGDLDNALKDYNASLEIRPISAYSFYGRGMVKRRNGDRAGAEADIVAGKAIKADIAEVFARYGVKE